jgi:hypothetical protein
MSKPILSYLKLGSQIRSQKTMGPYSFAKKPGYTDLLSDGGEWRLGTLAWCRVQSRVRPTGERWPAAPSWELPAHSYKFQFLLSCCSIPWSAVAVFFDQLLQYCLISCCSIAWSAVAWAAIWVNHLLTATSRISDPDPHWSQLIWVDRINFSC